MVKRTPVHLKTLPVVLEKKPWVGSETLTVMGIDPGVAAVGVAILAATQKRIFCQKLAVIRTKKADKKALRSLRVTADDSRRLKEIYNGLSDITDEFEPHALAFEVYSPYGKQGGSAWKASRVEGGVQVFGFDRGMLVLPFLPQDLKRALCGKASASKEDVIDAMSLKVENVENLLQALPKTQREHAADAAGYAYLAFEEMYRMRAMMGF